MAKNEDSLAFVKNLLGQQHTAQEMIVKTLNEQKAILEPLKLKIDEDGKKIDEIQAKMVATNADLLKLQETMTKLNIPNVEEIGKAVDVLMQTRMDELERRQQDRPESQQVLLLQRQLEAVRDQQATNLEARNVALQREGIGQTNHSS